ncbi:carbohydrate-binding family 9-like protein [Flavobacterium sp. MC2016-06]|uniref:carbohydrate-binding family 9-like protein n=1 Tax=Flavobacterium sp. MC2016-06 TaxID=2676308 RepID=UPI0012BAB0A2|nr:carbohydrate-binding family 9-like protein [Flavobacterium sp. MC2016-06]MBU3858844.1 carbohydrate-binding family 9-like protein [Flavobacterium sp. MC2016-06]
MHSSCKLLSLAVFCFSLMGYAQAEKEVTPKTYVAYKTPKEIVIDGDEADSAWDKVEWTSPFIDIEGVEKPKYTTQVKMLWDDNYYYLLAKIEEPHVWANLRQRDTIIFYNNDFEVFIDPDNDTHNYYELEINALNTAWDLFINKPYRENNVVLNDWNITGLKSAVKVNGTLNDPSDIDKGWTLEIAIPWAAYRKSYGENNVPKDNFWKVNFSRVNWQHSIVDGKYERKKDTEGKFLPEYNWVWSPMGVINMHEPEKWAYVYFSSKEIGGKDFFTIPEDEKVKWELYTLYRAQKRYYQQHNAWAKSLENIAKKSISVDNKILKPILENHSSGFNILIKSPFSNKTLIIKEDGKIITK